MGKGNWRLMPCLSWTLPFIFAVFNLYPFARMNGDWAKQLFWFLWVCQENHWTWGWLWGPQYRDRVCNVNTSQRVNLVSSLPDFCSLACPSFTTLLSFGSTDCCFLCLTSGLLAEILFWRTKYLTSDGWLKTALLNVCFFRPNNLWSVLLLTSYACLDVSYLSH